MSNTSDPSGQPLAPPLTFVVVCTANRCRSPLGEAFGRTVASQRSLDIDILSAGTRAEWHAPATDGAIAAGHKFGLDLTHHLSQPTTPELVARSTVLVCMEHQHVIDLVGGLGADPSRVFVLGDLAHRAETAEPRADDESFDDWLHRVGEDRTIDDVLSRRGEEIADPIGRANRHYREAARLINAAMSTVLDRGFGTTVTSSNGGPRR